jgi:hypothetical protein
LASVSQPPSPECSRSEQAKRVDIANQRRPVDQEAILLTDVQSREELLADDPFFLQPKRPPKKDSTDSSPSSDKTTEPGTSPSTP